MKIVRMGCTAVALSLAIGLTGCTTTGEQEFGSSVRHMIIGQTYDPAAPASDLAAPVDGEKAGLAVKAYRAEKKGGDSGASSALIVPIK